MTKNDYLALANVVAGGERAQRLYKKDPHAEALREASDHYVNRQYVLAYDRLKLAYEKVVSDMQRVLARNAEFEANKIAREQHKPLAIAKETVQRLKLHAQQVIDQFDRLRQDLENKPLVRLHLKKAQGPHATVSRSTDEAAPTTVASASETRVDTPIQQSSEITIGNDRYTKVPYAPPETGYLYSVRDKVSGERVIRVVRKSSDSAQVSVEILKEGRAPSQPIQISVEALARQASKGWCQRLIPDEKSAANLAEPTFSAKPNGTPLRLDIQNFGRCCADIVRANIKFGTQLIKDVGDGPFRAGDYEHAFLTFEQLAVGFNAAVGNSRRTIADGRRTLNADKTRLSGKEIQERTAAFVRNEQLINAAEREFASILEGLRMYLRAQQD